LVFLCTIILPVNFEESKFEHIMDEIRIECDKFNINFAGGHTEINKIVTSPIISGFMVGRCKKEELRGAFNAKDGDILIITKGVSVEGTSIIAELKSKDVIEKYGLDFYDKCISYKNRLSVLNEARIARKMAHAMHDLTEGGLVNGLYEIAVASEVSIDVNVLPIIPECKILCELFGLNPLGLITAGSLAITTDKKELTDLLKSKGFDVFEIGRIIKDGKKDVRYNGKVLKTYDKDEIVKIF